MLIILHKLGCVTKIFQCMLVSEESSLMQTKLRIVRPCFFSSEITKLLTGKKTRKITFFGHSGLSHFRFLIL